MQTPAQTTTLTLAVLASFDAAAFSETATLKQSIAAAKIMRDTCADLSLQLVGDNPYSVSPAFMELAKDFKSAETKGAYCCKKMQIICAIGSLANSTDKRLSTIPIACRADIYAFLKEAQEKYAATQQSAQVVDAQPTTDATVENFNNIQNSQIMTTQSSNILLVLANAVANFNGSMSDVRSAANILVSNLGINGFTTQTMSILVPFQKSLVGLGFEAELVSDFMRSLGIICECKDKAIGKYTKQHIATIKSFLKLANQKQAAIENAAYDAEMAAIAQHPVIAPVVAACAKSRELVAELANCNEARFFEICNEVEQIGYSNELFSISIDDIKAATKGKSLHGFMDSNFISHDIQVQIANALRAAAHRLNLFLMYNENGEFMNVECDETQGYCAFRVMDNVIGWVLDEPAATANENYTQIAIGLVAELENCSVQRFFEIRNQIQTIGYQFEKSRVIDCFDVANAFEAAGVRLGIVIVGDERKPIAGYKKFVVLDVFIGWILDEPTPTTKPRELAELDECLNAQIAAAATVDAITAGDTNGLFVQTANGEWAHVQDAADEVGLDIADYLDLYGDDLGSGDMFANCDTFEFDEEKRIVVQVSKPTNEPTKETPADKKLDFENMQLEQLQDIYAAAKERDGDDDDKDSAGELVEQFAKFIYDKANARNNEFLGLANVYRTVVTDYTLKNVCPQFGFELSIGLLRKNANAKVFTLSCNHPNLINGFECLTAKGYHLLSDFDSFLHISRDFFRDILRKIE